MKNKSHTKGVETRKQNDKKILDLFKYEIWRDPLNYTVIKDGKYRYFSTFKLALVDIRDELVKNKLAGANNLDSAINAIKVTDDAFLKALSTSLAGLGRE